VLLVIPCSKMRSVLPRELQVTHGETKTYMRLCHGVSCSRLFFKTLSNPTLMAQCLNPGQVNPHKHFCENLRYGMDNWYSALPQIRPDLLPSTFCSCRLRSIMLVFCSCCLKTHINLAYQCVCVFNTCFIGSNS